MAVIPSFRGISIHAPPRGATISALPVWAAFLISIHAPPRGATALKWTDTLAIKLFQFTPLREGRLRSGAGKPLDITFQFTPLREGRQSVRALENPLTLHFNSRPSARGDACRAAQRKDRRYFNSRPSARGDVIVPSTARYCGLFQFTPLREGRPQTMLLNPIVD